LPTATTRLLKYQLTEQHTEDQHNDKNSQRNIKQDLGYTLRAHGDIGEAEETGDNGYNKKYDGPLQHQDFLLIEFPQKVACSPQGSSNKHAISLSRMLTDTVAPEKADYGERGLSG
jgi:hypothetical protein